jgi:N-hydroxyarylamine O-acetyltransferase
MPAMVHHPEMQLDLGAYFGRIGYGGGAAPSLDSLRAVHLAHARSIPFENVDVLLGRAIRLDLEGLQAKLVAGERGGYCFEHNTLFAAALEAMGFRVTRLAARVRFGHRRVGARTHMLLRVEVEGAPWLADVGFGGLGILEPIPFAPNEPVEQFGWRYRLVRDEQELVLQSLEPDGWADQYGSTLEPQLEIDYEVANHYTSTHPASPFTRTLTAQRPDPDRPESRIVLRGRKLSVHRPSGPATTERVQDRDLMDVLAERFGLRLPPDTILP